MLAEYVQFVQAVMPSVPPAAVSKLLTAAGFAGMVDETYFAHQLGDRLSQGDVVADLLWIVELEDGRYGRATQSGLLMSVSCDVDNADWLQFAPCAPFDASVSNAREITRNLITELYYIPAHHGRPARVADLSRAQSMRADRIHTELRSGRLARVDAFTQLGYYHFITKLALHFLRPQTDDEVRYACQSPLRERARYAASAAVGLTRYLVRGESV